MATKISTIYTLITADDGPLKKGLASARTASISGAAKIQAALNKINFRAVGLAAVAFGGTVAYGMKKAVDAASDLEEATGKFNVVFRDQLGQAEAWAKELVAAYGLSSREAKEYLSSIQDLLKPMGVASDTAAKLSNEVVKLAVDLGSFNNQKTPDVMRDIQSALVGNFETMKKYGVVLNETVIKQEALRQGIIKGKEALAAAQKAQVAYELIVRGSADAMGDWQRTSKGYANTMKQVRATIEEIAAKIGDPLMPAIADVVRGFNDWATENNKLLQQDIPSYTRKVGEAVTALASAVGPLMAMYNKLPDGTTGALGAGIIGRMLFGGLGAGFIVASLAFIAQEVSANTTAYENAFKKTIFGDIILGYRQAIDRTNDLLRWLGILDEKATEVGKGMRDALSWKQKADSGGAGFSTGGGFGGGIVTEPKPPEPPKPDYLGASALEMNRFRQSEILKRDIAQETYDAIDAFEMNRFRQSEVLQRDAVTTIKDTFDEMIQLSERTAWAMQENFSNVFFDAMTGELKTFGDYAKSILTSIQRAIADITAQMVTESLFGKGMKGGGWLTSLGSLFDGGSTTGSSATSLSNARWSPRAAGGPVSMGSPYLVGEKGPEWFIPGKDGTIVPNKSGVQIDVNVVNNLGQEADVSQSSSWMSPDQMVTDIILNKKMTSRGFRQSMRS